MADLLAALLKLREEVMYEQDQASSPPAYMSESDYSSYMGKELAYDDVLGKLNKIIEEHS